MDVRDIIRIFNDICEAVKYLHDFTPDPIAHRDLKTANICLTEQTDPILMDLGELHILKIFIFGYTIHPAISMKT